MKVNNSCFLFFNEKIDLNEMKKIFNTFHSNNKNFNIKNWKLFKANESDDVIWKNISNNKFYFRYFLTTLLTIFFIFSICFITIGIIFNYLFNYFIIIII
jgi:hypothetical protein